MPLDDLGRTLLIMGLLLAALGGLLLLAGHVPWLGRLPGDISVERGNFRFYAPIATSLLLSLLLTLLVNLLARR
jgi:membrane protein implicated in regulation of membrane protease activity